MDGAAGELVAPPEGGGGSEWRPRGLVSGLVVADASDEVLPGAAGVSLATSQDGDDDGDGGTDMAGARGAASPPGPREGAALAWPGRVPRADDLDGEEFVVDAELAADEVSDPVDPAEPVVSANAIGTDATAEPTPNATASAPTRPT